jgi:hypothetical protein
MNNNRIISDDEMEIGEKIERVIRRLREIEGKIDGNDKAQEAEYSQLSKQLDELNKLLILIIRKA